MAKTLSSEIPDQFGGAINNEALNRIVSRIEALHDERKELNGSIREVYDEAREAGFVPAILRQIVRERGLEPRVRHDQYALLEAYRSALGMLADTPLGEAALNAAAANGSVGGTAKKPRPFAQQSVHPPRRGRPRGSARGRDPDQALDEARRHLGEDVAGIA